MIPFRLQLLLSRASAKIGRKKSPAYFNDRITRAVRREDLKFVRRAIKGGADPFINSGAILIEAARKDNDAIFLLLFDALCLQYQSHEKYQQIMRDIGSTLLSIFVVTDNEYLAIYVMEKMNSKPPIGFDIMINNGCLQHKSRALLAILSRYNQPSYWHVAFDDASRHKHFELIQIFLDNKFRGFPLMPSRKTLDEKGIKRPSYEDNAIIAALKDNRTELAKRWLIEHEDRVRLDCLILTCSESCLTSLLGHPADTSQWPKRLHDANLTFLIKRHLEATGLNPLKYLSVCPDSHKRITSLLLTK